MRIPESRSCTTIIVDFTTDTTTRIHSLSRQHRRFSPRYPLTPLGYNWTTSSILTRWSVATIVSALRVRVLHGPYIWAEVWKRERSTTHHIAWREQNKHPEGGRVREESQHQAEDQAGRRPEVVVWVWDLSSRRSDTSPGRSHYAKSGDIRSLRSC